MKKTAIQLIEDFRERLSKEVQLITIFESKVKKDSILIHGNYIRDNSEERFLVFFERYEEDGKTVYETSMDSSDETFMFPLVGTRNFLEETDNQ